MSSTRCNSFQCNHQTQVTLHNLLEDNINFSYNISDCICIYTGHFAITEMTLNLGKKQLSLHRLRYKADSSVYKTVCTTSCEIIVKNNTFTVMLDNILPLVYVL